MKYLIALLLISGSYVAGTMLHSNLSELFVHEREVQLDSQRTVVLNGYKVTIDLLESTVDDWPTTVTLLEDTAFKEEGMSDVWQLVSGTQVKLLDVSGSRLVVADPNNPQSRAEVVAPKTNIFEMIARRRFERRMGTTEQSMGAMGSEDQGGLMGMGQEAVEGAMGSEQELAVEEDSAEEAGAEEAVVEAVTLDGEQIVTTMKESLAQHPLKEFQAEQVKSWTAGEDERLDGVPYQIGMVNYEAETIFGLQEVQAKALIRNGKVERWIHAKTGMEVR